MEIIKVLNNNVVVAKNDSSEEIIAMGKGIAFGKKKGDEILIESVDKVFKLENGSKENQILSLIQEIPIEYMELAYHIISAAETKFKKHFNSVLYVTLSDHIYNTIARYRDGVELKNPLLWDIKQFYNDEYKMAKFALDAIEEKMNIRLNDDEIGFIAMHFVNAQTEESLDTIYQITKIMQEVTNIVRYYFNVSLDEESVSYHRFITHLKFFAQRLLNKKKFESDEDEELSLLIKRKYKNSYNCTLQIVKFINENYNYEITEDERIYLTIHIERLIYKK